MSFQYRPLPRASNAFRLLELQSGKKQDGIRCSLQIYAFPPSAETTYEPISYCWGDAKIKKSITVNDCRVDITKSLYMALVRLRLEDRPRLLWVDAICINQKDDAEKNDQVQIMRDIYRFGRKTLAWLGEGSRISTRRGFLFITVLQEYQRSRQSMLTFRSSYNDSLYNDFLALFEEPYFSRAWIIQEIVVSSSIEMFSNDQAVSWDVMNSALKNIEFFPWSEFKMQRSLGNINSITMARSNFQGGVKQSLLQVLSNHRKAAATCPKDKIYAFLGLVDPEDLKTYSLMPNYSNDYAIEDTYVDIASSILRSSTNLDLLSEPQCIPSASARQHVPTWVPEWNKSPIYIPLLDFSQTTSLMATRSSISRPIFRERMVVLAGYVFDEVDQIGYPFPETQKPFIAEKKRSTVLWHTCTSNWQEWDFEAQKLKAWKNWRHLVSTQNSRMQGQRESPPEISIWKTITASYSFQSESEESEARQQWEYDVGETRGLLGIFDQRLIWHVYCIAQSGYNKFLRTKTHHPTDIGGLFDHCYGRTAFVSRNSYFGLGPPNVQPGDNLAFLEGGKVPYILRRKGEMYEFVGDCYIYSIMQGKLFDKSKSRQICLV